MSQKRFSVAVVETKLVTGPEYIRVELKKLNAFEGTEYRALLIDCEGANLRDTINVFAPWATDAPAAMYLFYHMDLDALVALGLSRKAACGAATAAIRKSVNRNEVPVSIWSEARRQTAGIAGIKDGDPLTVTVKTPHGTISIKGTFKKAVKKNKK